MGAVAVVNTAMLWGMEARPVRVEVSLSKGLPGITIVGRPDASVLESRSRVRCAMRAAGFKVPRDTVTVNLSPSELHKAGTAFDLPIAVAILLATNQIPQMGYDSALVVGELSLEGEVSPPRGLLAYERFANETGLTLLTAPGIVANESNAYRWVCALAQLREGLGSLESRADIRPRLLVPAAVRDFCEVAGQDVAKRALGVAAAGRLGVLMVGPPGIGKTMLASCLPGIMPAMNDDELYETLLLHSLSENPNPDGIGRMRPFRAPHHSSSAAGLVGGGRPVRPGEISLAHRGVLFLDELAEFGVRTLQTLRQPMEEKRVRITRVEGTYEFPCDFQFVAASNPCPCGHLGDPNVECSCSEAAIRSYQARLAGPLVDRVDIVVRLERPSAEQILDVGGVASPKMLTMVERAWAMSANRDASRRREHVSSQPDSASSLGRAMDNALMNASARKTFERLLVSGALSVRALFSIVRVARAVADYEGLDEVSDEHVFEALLYRDPKVVG